MDELLRRLAALDPDDPARSALRRHLVEAQLPLVHHLAQRFRGRGEPYDDLVQVGTIGLLNAVDRFDPERGSFTGFAVPTILGEIRRHFRDRGWALRVPRRLQEMGRQVSEAREVLTQQLGRSPTVQEIARHIDTDPDLVLEALDTAGVYATVPLPSTPEEGEMAPLGFIDSGLEPSSSVPPCGRCSRGCRRASGRSSRCASSGACRSHRSPPRSASRRCTCRV